MSGQNYAKTPFTAVASLECKDTSMEGSDKRSLSESASPTRDGILRSGPKHARAYKSLCITLARSTEVPIEIVSELLAIESFRSIYLTVVVKHRFLKQHHQYWHQYPLLRLLKD